MQRVCQRGALVKMSQDIAAAGHWEARNCRVPRLSASLRRDQDIKQRTTKTGEQSFSIRQSLVKTPVVLLKPLRLLAVTMDPCTWSNGAAASPTELSAPHRRLRRLVTCWPIKCGYSRSTFPDDQIQVVLIDKDFGLLA